MEKKAKTVYEPTDEESDAIEQECVAAVWEELQALHDEELSPAMKVLACLKAFRAVREVAAAGRAALEKKHPECSWVSFGTDTTMIVCSVFASLDADSPEEIAPCSVGGVRLVSLLQAAKALEGMSAVHCAFDDGEEVFGDYLADEAITLCEAHEGISALRAKLDKPKNTT